MGSITIQGTDKALYYCQKAHTHHITGHLVGYYIVQCEYCTRCPVEVQTSNAIHSITVKNSALLSSWEAFSIHFAVLYFLHCHIHNNNWQPDCWSSN